MASETPQILYIIIGYANDFIALEEYSKLNIFADYGLNELNNDVYRYDKNLWFDGNNL